MAESLGTVELGIQVTGAEQAQADLKNLGRQAQSTADSFADWFRSISDAGRKLDEIKKPATLAELQNELKRLEGELRGADLGSAKFQELARQIGATKGEISAINAKVKDLGFSFNDSLNRLNALSKANLTPLSNQIKEVAAGSRQFGTALGQIAAGAGIAVGLVEVVSQLKQIAVSTVETAISFESAQIRLKALSSSAQEYATIQALVKQNAKDLNLSQIDSASAFAQTLAFLKPVGATLQEVQDLYIAVNVSTKNLGRSSSEAAAILLQLSQGFAKGKLNGDELVSIQERFPQFTAALRQAFNSPKQSLSELGAAGLITKDKILEAIAIVNQTELGKFKQTLETAGASQDRLKNSFQDLQLTASNSTAIKLFFEGLTLAIKGLDAAVSIVQAIANTLPNALGAINDVIKKTFKIDLINEAEFAWKKLTARLEQYAKLADKLSGKEDAPRVVLPTAGGGGQRDVQSTINSIDNLNAKLKTQRDELNKIEIGSTRFQELTQAIRSTELQLGAATAAAKGTGAALGELQRISTAGFDFRQQDLGASQTRLQLAQQVAQAEQDLASQRLTLEGALLSAQEQRALKGVQDESTRQAIVEAFQRRREELEDRQFVLREAAAKVEQQRQIESLRLETQLTELAARRGVIQAQIALAQATRSGDPNQIQAAQEGLQLANRELQIAQQIGREKLQSQERINQLRLQQLELEKKAAQADNLPPLPQPLAAGNGILEFKFDPTPVDRNSQAVGQAAEQIGASNQGLVEQVRLNTAAIEALANKDWTVQVQVENQAGGDTTINSYSELQ